MAQTAGKRTAQAEKPKGGKIALIVALAVVVILIGGYLILCAAAGSGTFLPNTTVAGIDLGGQTQEQALDTLKTQLPDRLSQLSVPFVCEGQEFTIPGSDATVDDQAVESALQEALDQQSGSFFTRGAQYLGAITGGAQYSVPVTLKDTPAVVSEAVKKYADPEAQTTWEVSGDQLVFHKGVTGRTIDVNALTDAAAERFTQLLNDSSAENAPWRPRSPPLLPWTRILMPSRRRSPWRQPTPT